MTESTYTQTFPVLQRSQFWSNYMSAIKGMSLLIGRLVYNWLGTFALSANYWSQVNSLVGSAGLNASGHPKPCSGPLCAEEPPYTPPQPSIWTQYRPVDITLYDLIYGEYYHAVLEKVLTAPPSQGSPPPPSSDRLAYPYTYRPLHTDIYGISRNRVARMWWFLFQDQVVTMRKLTKKNRK